MRAVLRLQLRRLRFEAVPGLTLAGLVFVTTLLLATGPRMLERISNQSLGGELGAASATERDIVISELSRPTADVPKTAADVGARLDEMSAQLPPDLGALVSDRNYVIDTTSWDVTAGTQFQSILDLRLQPGLENHVELIDGKLPTGKVIRRVVDSVSGENAVVYEAMLDEAAAKEMGVTVGQELPLSLSQFDPRNRGVGVQAGVKIVGIYRATNPNEDFWLNDPLATGFRFRQEGDLTIIESNAILSPDAYETLQGIVAQKHLPMNFQWRFWLDTSRIDATRAGELETTLAPLREPEAAQRRERGAGEHDHARRPARTAAGARGPLDVSVGTSRRGGHGRAVRCRVVPRPGRAAGVERPAADVRAGAGAWRAHAHRAPEPGRRGTFHQLARRRAGARPGGVDRAGCQLGGESWRGRAGGPDHDCARNGPGRARRRGGGGSTRRRVGLAPRGSTHATSAGHRRGGRCGSHHQRDRAARARPERRG